MPGRHFPESVAGYGRNLQFDRNQESIYHAQYILDANMTDEKSKKLENHIWIILENNTEAPFLTSDAPLVKFAHKKSDIVSYDGILAEGIEVAFPLNSKYLLVLLDRKYFSKYSGSEFNVIKINDIKNVKFYNFLQIKDSYRQLYCEKNNFKFIEKILNKYPVFCNINKKRVEVKNYQIEELKEYMIISTPRIEYNDPNIIGKSCFKP